MEIILVMKDYDELLDLKNKVESVYGREKICTFQAAEDAAAYAKSRHIDVCYTEVVLKEMSGIALAKELKKKGEDIQINFISDTQEYALDAWKLFINDYLLKPVSLSAVQHSRDCSR